MFVFFGLFCIQHAHTTKRAAVSQTTIGGLTGLIEDVLTLIPKEDVFIMFLEKLDSSMEFANLVESIGTPEFVACFDSLKVCAQREREREICPKHSMRNNAVARAVFCAPQRSTDLKKTATELSKHKIDVRKIIELLQSFCRFGVL